MSFAAGRRAAHEVVMPRCVSVSVLVVVREWEYKAILDDTDEQTWEVMSEDWNLAERWYQPGCLKDPTPLPIHDQVCQHSTFSCFVKRDF